MADSPAICQSTFVKTATYGAFVRLDCAQGLGFYVNLRFGVVEGLGLGVRMHLGV